MTLKAQQLSNATERKRIWDMKGPWSEPSDNFSAKREFLGSLAVRTALSLPRALIDSTPGVELRLQAKSVGGEKIIHTYIYAKPRDHWIPEVEAPGRMAENLENDGHKYSRLDEDYKATDPKSSANLKHREAWKVHQGHHDQSSQNQWRKENLKQRKKMLHTKKTKIKIALDFLLETRQARRQRNIFKDEIKAVGLELYTQQIYIYIYFYLYILGQFISFITIIKVLYLL